MVSEVSVHHGREAMVGRAVHVMVTRKQREGIQKRTKGQDTPKDLAPRVICFL
jgi:hypothetical protein